MTGQPLGALIARVHPERVDEAVFHVCWGISRKGLLGTFIGEPLDGVLRIPCYKGFGLLPQREFYT
jgi:hypothetical protein